MEPESLSKGRHQEAIALLTAARAVLERRSFAHTAKALLGAGRSMLGAAAGFVSLRAAGGSELEVAALDPGSFELEAAGSLPEPLALLVTRMVETGRLVLENALAEGPLPVSQEPVSQEPVSQEQVSQRPVSQEPVSQRPRRPAPENALLAPILLREELVGCLGLLDKPGGFTAADSQLAEVLAEMTAVAILEKRTVNGLESDRHALAEEARDNATQLRMAEEAFRTLVENLPDVIARFDPELRHLYVSPAVEAVMGGSRQDYVGKTNQELGMPTELTEAWDAALERAFASGMPETLELAFAAPEGTRHFDCRIIPEGGPGGTVPTVLTVSRDVSDRWLALAAEQRARATADALREATVALTRSLDRETVLVTLLDRLRRMVPFDRASVMLVEEASRLSVRAVFDGDRFFPLTEEVRPVFDPAEHPIVRSILTTGTAILIPDVHAHPEWSLPADESSEASWMGVPLFARGDVTGLVSLSKREPSYFNEEHVKLAEAMSSQASVAVENAILFEQMQAATARMQALSRSLVEAQESERRLISRELHDEAGQALVSLRYGLRLLEKELDQDGIAPGQVAELVQRTDAVIEGLHRLAADLRPVSLDHLGLEAALRQYLRSTASKFGLAVRFKARGFAENRLPVEMETALYRVVQEAMTNVVRHAQATRVDVLVALDDGRVRVMVEDDGVGFDPEEVRRGDHLGLLGLGERAEALGGTLTLESAPGSGATVVVEVPSVHPHPDR